MLLDKRLLVGFPTGRDSTTFRDNGTEVSSLSRDKGTMGQAQNLATERKRCSTTGNLLHKNFTPNVFV